MAVFDMLKGLTGSKQNEAEADGEPEIEAGGRPGTVMQKALSAAASALLAGSKRAADLVVSRCRPALMLDAMLSPDAIRSLTETRDRHTNIAIQDLTQLCTNTLETFELATKLRAEVKEPKNGKPPKLERLDRVIDAIQAVAEGRKEEAAELASALFEDDDGFNHPVLARFMLERAQSAGAEQEQLMQWCDRTLYFWPLDQELLGFAIELTSGKQRAVYEQMLILAERKPAREGIGA